MYDIVALGELLIDFTCISKDDAGYPTMAAHPGGAPANFLAAATAAGAKTAMLGKVGNDTFGKLLLNTLREADIDIRGMVVDNDVFTTLAFVTLDASGNREFAFSRKPGADTRLSFEEMNLSILQEAKLLHIGTLSLTDEPARSCTQKAVAYAKELGKLISCDPNLRKPLWNDLAEAKQQMEWAISQADIVKISDEEVKFLWGIGVKEGAEKILGDYGAKLVFVTCGARGCLFHNAKAWGEMPALGGIDVMDTTGAGDIFGGSAVWKVLQSGKKPEELSEAELQKIVAFACTAAGLSTTRPGGISSVPSMKDIELLLE